MPSKRVVVNTSPLIAPDRIGRLSVLQGLFGKVVRPKAVLEELLAGETRLGLSSELAQAPWLLTEDDPPEMALRKELGRGETAAITLAYTTKADLVILHDLQARLVAESLNLRITGTLGVLAAAHQCDLIPDLESAFDDLKAAGFRISEVLLGEHLRR